MHYESSTELFGCFEVDLQIVSGQLKLHFKLLMYFLEEDKVQPLVMRITPIYDK